MDVHPTSAPPDSFSRPEKEQKSKEESYTDSTYTDSTEQIEKETDTKVTHKKKKKPSKLKNIHKLSAYPISNEGIVLESQSNTGSGSSNFTDNSTQVGQTLFKVSGILLYGKKCKI
ncbi:hypothetical protein RV18_GL001035 [Enterococcus termitis]|nr:hypothetical protein RV18_GL001035 [Enterococcus termitis]